VAPKWVWDGNVFFFFLWCMAVFFSTLAASVIKYRNRLQGSIVKQLLSLSLLPRPYEVINLACMTSCIRRQGSQRKLGEKMIFDQFQNAFKILYNFLSARLTRASLTALYILTHQIVASALIFWDIFFFFLHCSFIWSCLTKGFGSNCFI
jgi:hypothetical protein